MHARSLEKLAEKNPAQEVFDKYKDKGAVLVDMTDLYCPEGMCQPVVGNVYVYIDENHVSKAYGRTMAKTMKNAPPRAAGYPLACSRSKHVPRIYDAVSSYRKARHR